MNLRSTGLSAHLHCLWEANERDYWIPNDNCERWREVQEQVENGKGVLEPDNSSSVLNIVPISIKNKFDPKCLDTLVMIRNTHHIQQSIADRISGKHNSIRSLSGPKVLVPQLWARWFIVRSWVRDSDTPGAPVATEMQHHKTFTLLAEEIMQNW